MCEDGLLCFNLSATVLAIKRQDWLINASLSHLYKVVSLNVDQRVVVLEEELEAALLENESGDFVLSRQ